MYTQTYKIQKRGVFLNLFILFKKYIFLSLLAGGKRGTIPCLGLFRRWQPLSSEGHLLAGMQTEIINQFESNVQGES
jgi:hypothetical protein